MRLPGKQQIADNFLFFNLHQSFEGVFFPNSFETVFVVKNQHPRAVFLIPFPLAHISAALLDLGAESLPLVCDPVAIIPVSVLEDQDTFPLALVIHPTADIEIPFTPSVDPFSKKCIVSELAFIAVAVVFPIGAPAVKGVLLPEPFIEVPVLRDVPPEPRNPVFAEGAMKGVPVGELQRALALASEVLQGAIIEGAILIIYNALAGHFPLIEAALKDVAVMSGELSESLEEPFGKAAFVDRAALEIQFPAALLHIADELADVDVALEVLEPAVAPLAVQVPLAGVLLAVGVAHNSLAVPAVQFPLAGVFFAVLRDKRAPALAAVVFPMAGVAVAVGPLESALAVLRVIF